MQSKNKLTPSRQFWTLLGVAVATSISFALFFPRAVGDGSAEGRAIRYIRLINQLENQYRATSGRYGSLEAIRNLDPLAFKKSESALIEYYAPILSLTNNGYTITLAALDNKRPGFVSNEAGTPQWTTK